MDSLVNVMGVGFHIVYPRHHTSVAIALQQHWLSLLFEDIVYGHRFIFFWLKNYLVFQSVNLFCSAARCMPISAPTVSSPLRAPWTTTMTMMRMKKMRRMWLSVSYFCSVVHGTERANSQACLIPTSIINMQSTEKNLKPTRCSLYMHIQKNFHCQLILQHNSFSVKVRNE